MKGCPYKKYKYVIRWALIVIPPGYELWNSFPAEMQNYSLFLFWNLVKFCLSDGLSRQPGISYLCPGRNNLLPELKAMPCFCTYTWKLVCRKIFQTSKGCWTLISSVPDSTGNWYPEILKLSTTLEHLWCCVNCWGKTYNFPYNICWITAWFFTQLQDAEKILLLCLPSCLQETDGKEAKREPWIRETEYTDNSVDGCFVLMGSL